MRPKHTNVLNEWLATHEHPFWQPDFAQIMRSYRVKYVVMEMVGEWEPGLWQEAQAAKELKPVDCFPAPQEHDAVELADLHPGSAAAALAGDQCLAARRLVGPGGLGRVG